ncbi:MAG TPA: aldo/keto reductase [Candidatus Limnocylindria bacterium]|nr:aldo/keto reductase [Candidatus Limnocylindria bacterium]
MIARARFGRTGHLSARTIFGAAALARATQADADSTLELLLAHGVDHIDTAASYGDSELRIAPWLARFGRDRFFLATKTGQRTYAGARDEIRASLGRLGTDHVDLIQLHNLVAEDEWERAFAPDGALRAAVEARDAGLARWIGVTGHGVLAPRQHRRSLERFAFDSVLFPYNVTQMRGQYAADAEALIAYCDAHGVAMQTIKSITLGPWRTERPATPTTWYEPLTEQRDIDLAVWWVLSRPELFLNTVGDLGLLPKVLDAASRQGPRPSDEDMARLVEHRAMVAFFV